MSLSFLLDEDLSYRVAEGLRRRGVDAISVYEIDRANRRIPDGDQLEYASAAGRVIVTYNRADYQKLDASWRADGHAHSGILWCTERIIRRHAIGDLVNAIESMAGQHESLAGICLPLTRPRP